MKNLFFFILILSSNCCNVITKETSSQTRTQIENQLISSFNCQLEFEKAKEFYKLHVRLDTCLQLINDSNSYKSNVIIPLNSFVFGLTTTMPNPVFIIGDTVIFKVRAFTKNDSYNFCHDSKYYSLLGEIYVLKGGIVVKVVDYYGGLFYLKKQFVR